MTHEERVERFKTENIVVQCETMEEAKCFIDWCYANGFTGGIFVKMEDEIFVYSSPKHYPEEKLYEIITYKDFMKEKKMTKLEYYASKDIFKDIILCYIAHFCKYGIDCDDKKCSECEFNHDATLYVKSLLEEHKELIKIKLTQWEYDFLDYLSFIGGGGTIRFEYYDVTKYLFYTKGHFKGVTDTLMTINEIIDNCEVV